MGSKRAGPTHAKQRFELAHHLAEPVLLPELRDELSAQRAVQQLKQAQGSGRARLSKPRLDISAHGLEREPKVHRFVTKAWSCSQDDVVTVGPQSLTERDERLNVAPGTG